MSSDQSSSVVRLGRGTLLMVASVVGVVACDAVREPVSDQGWNPECQGCGLELQLLWTLGDDSTGLVGPEARVARKGAYYYVSDQDTYSSVQVFHRETGFVGAIGQEGQGPGEFNRVADLDIDSSGILWVTDAANHRVSLYRADGPVHALLTTFLLPQGETARFGMTILPDGRFLMNGSVATADRIGKATHLVHPAEGVVWSVDDATVAPRSVTPEWRSFGLTGEDTFWLAWRHNEYRLERRRIGDGSLVGVVEPDREWFTAHKDERPAQRNADPHSGTWYGPAAVLDIYYESGRIWVLGEYHSEEGTFQVIEVFDQGNPAPRVSHIFGPTDGSYFVQFSDDGHLIEFMFADGGTRLRLWSVALEPDA